MVEFLHLKQRRGAVANVFYYVFNALLALAVVGLTVIFANDPWPAVFLLVLSKWRTVAVRPRYWRANILSSLPDLFLGLGVIVISWQAGASASGGAIFAQIILAILYALWLTLVKPQEGRKWANAQAQISQFVALAALFSLAFALPLVVVVGLAALIAWAAARQAIGMYDENAAFLLELLWGALVAELAFAAWHWTVAYQIPASGVRIPQISLVAAVVGFAAARIYVSLQDDGKLSWSEIGWPLILAGVILLILVLAGGALF